MRAYLACYYQSCRIQKNGARLSQPQQPRTQLERTSSGNLKIPEY